MMAKGDLGLWLLMGGLVVLAGGAGAVEVIELSDLEKRVQKIADGIERAEGYGVPGAKPTVNNNPGDLMVDTISKGVGYDAAGFVVYASYEDGRQALEKQVRMMLNGQSKYYNPGMTISDMSLRYTATEQDAWAFNVASTIGVTPDTPLNQIPV
jgi:hypothetical protein